MEHATRSTGLDAAGFVAAPVASHHRGDGDAGDAQVVSRWDITDRGVVVADPEMQRLYRLLARLARSELPVLVRGEPGTGKTTAARAVHAWSARAGAPLVMFDCGGQPDGVIERELFGCERGAFAASSSRKPGQIERAHGGTLVLDQVHALAPATQTRLLHLLEHRRVTRIGGKHERTVDVRIVATTSADLAAAVAAGRFRRDLYDRLSAASVALPPLRVRPSEIAILAQHFVAAARSQNDGAPVSVSPAALAQLATRLWTGNVRELEHAMAYAAALVDGDRIEPWHLPEAEAREPATPAAPDEHAAPADDTLARPADSFRPIAEELQALERRRMTEALRATGGVQRRAAELIGMPVRTFTFKLTQYGLREGAPQPPPALGSGRIARRRSRGTTGPGVAGSGN